MKGSELKSVLSPKCVAVSVWKVLGRSKMSLSKVRSSGSLANNDDVVKCGYLKKLKTMKKKYFVLRCDTGPDSPARLEYYDNEKKFKAGAPPKKPITLSSCFSINRKKDPKHNHVIALYTNNDSVSMAAESEAELTDWLAFLKHHMGDGDDQTRNLYEHVWLVVVQQRGLGSSKGINGEYHICLTYRSIALVKFGDCQKKIEFPLNSIRRCGHTGSFFFIGLGRSAVTGAGDIWMLTEDAVIAENIHSIIKRAMNDPYNNMSEEPVRERAQSVNGESMTRNTPCPLRNRCGSMPSSRNRTSSEGSVQTAPNKLQPPNCSHQVDGPGSFCLHPITRPKSIPSSSESVESRTSGDDFEGLHSRTPDNMDQLGEEESYVDMGSMKNESSSHGREYMLQPSLKLPINSRSSMGHSLDKVLVSPVSGSSSIEGPCPSMFMGMIGSQSDQLGYMPMDRVPSQGQGTSGSENAGYMSMGPLNSPGSTLASWPPLSSSQVSSPPHSANHSRIPSLVDDTTDSYMHMVSGGHVNEYLMSSLETYPRDREGYVDMTPTPAIPLPCSPSDGDSLPEMSPGSSCSFTSGTPSSDHRFHDFIAEKSGSGSYCGYSEDDESSMERPIRTNSVGSKPEQFRSRKNSAPILGSSPISNSWSGTPGTFFRGFLQTRSQERSDLMEFDFSKNKSCDSITSDKEKKSLSIESIKRTLADKRHRSNSKSSGNGKSSMFDSMKRDKKKSESESSGKSIEIPERKNCSEINPSPRRNAESYDGYLPMKPAISLSQSSTSEYLDMASKDHFSRQSFADSYLDMSRSNDRIVSSSSTSAPHEGYVDMSQGKGIGPLASISSSATTSSNSLSSTGARVGKVSSTFIPMSSQDTCSQLDEYMPVDLRSNVDSSSQSHDGEKAKKKEKKSMKRKSFKDSTKRKKSDPIAVIGKGDGGEGIHEGSRKGTSPLSHLSTFLGRKNSSGTPPKTPLSPTGSPLPKSSRGTPSPFSSLTRSKNRECKDGCKDSVTKENPGVISLGSGIGTSCIEESSREAEESAISSDSANASISAQTVPTSGEQLGKISNKRSSGIFEPSEVTDAKAEEKQITLGLESVSQTLATISQQQKQQAESSSGDIGAYVNLVLGSASSEKNLSVENKQRKISTGSMSADYMNISPMNTSRISESEVQQQSPPLPPQNHNYVNMCPGGRRLETTHHTPSHLSPQSAANPSTTSSSCKSSNTGKSDNNKKSPSVGYSGYREQNRRESKRLSGAGSDDGEGESGYLLMTPGQPPPKSTSPRVVTRRPDIPPALLGGRPDPSLTATLERLNLGGSGGNSERCRCHSGPGAPEGSAVGGEIRVKKQLSEPRVGSGGQGNSGRAASACSSPVSYSPPTSPTLGGSVSSVSSLSEGGLSSASSTCTVVNVGVGRRESGGLGATGSVQETQSDSTSSTSASLSSSSQQSLTTVSSGSGDSGLNYVSLDLGPARCEGIMPSPRASRRTASGTSTHALGTGPQESTVGEEDYSLSYAQIDFIKSEGLRTTSLSRDRH